MPTEPAVDRTFVLLHGYQHHRPPGHWLRWLADELVAGGCRVSYPQLPEPDHPDRDGWLAALDARLAEAGGALTVVAHSLGSWLWFNAAARLDRPVARVMLVAPPGPDTVRLFRDLVGFDLPLDRDLAQALHKTNTELVGGDDDPWCAGGAAQQFGAPLDLPTTMIPGGAHLDLQAGYGPWPSMLDWCLTGAHPVVRREYAPTG